MTTSHTITLQGKQVHFEYTKSQSEKSGYTFILVHGFLACTFTFRKLVPYLTSDSDTYCLDLIGFGKSEKPADYIYSYKNYGALIIDFIKKMELKNVVLIGHSMGGQVCLHAAKHSPDFIEKMVLVCCSGYFQKAKSSAVAFSYFPFLKFMISCCVSRKRVENILRSTLYDATLMDDEMVQAYLKPAQERGFCNALIGLLRNREGDMGTDELQTIRKPTLLIWGEEDRIVPLRKGVHLRLDLPHSSLSVFPEAGHQVIEEKPLEVYSEIKNWLNAGKKQT